MTVDLKTLAQNALATIITRQPNAVVEVVANGNTVNAVRDSKTSEPNLTDEGETGITTGTVRCNADDIGVITKGQTITVAGVSVFALAYKVDPCGAIATINYSEQKPI
ncbi:MAG: hypothetical protein PHH96_02185 [Smithellaceae bacterium]|jgi:intracellular sulfur oxidation DsrE/DsrF family protein|nr:hypothetical protein [Smithellaceae bacterium]MDD5413610.1 hypothetical protein [Smithellaceae bacterium]